MREWDIAVVFAHGKYARAALPVELSAALREAGMTRAVVRLTDDGILLVPYKPDPAGVGRAPVELPEWGR